MGTSLQKLFTQGGPGSGFKGHKGRKGEVGGSLPGTHQGDYSTYQSVKENPSALSDPNVADRHIGRIIGEWVATDGRSPEAAKMLEYILPHTIPGGYFDLFHPGDVTLYRGGKGKGTRSWSTDRKVAEGYGEISEVKITKSTPAFSIDKFLGGSGKSEYEVIFKNSRLFHHGGPGSGFRGHRGRPGQVGGSSKEEFAVRDLTPEQREHRKKMRRERRQRRKEQGKGQQPLQPQQPVQKPPHQLRTERIVSQLGYPTERVTSELGRGPAFEVDGKTYYTGASFSPSTGEIRIYNAGKISDESMTGMLAHEIQHSRWNEYRKAYQQQYIEVGRSLNTSDNPEDWIITGGGYLKNKTDKERLWAYDINQEFIKDANRWERLKKSDGISEYSRSYWKQANKSGSDWDYDRAIDETLAEIARIQTGNARTGDKKAIRPIWQSLYSKIRFRTGVKKNRLLFIFGGPGSGHHRHKGRPGEVGGSSKDGEGGSSMDKVVLKDLSGATARAEHDGSIAIDPNRWKDVSEASRRGILAHELAHQTVEDYVLNNNEEWDRAVEFLQLEKNDRSPSGYLFIGGNTRIGEAITDAVSVYITDGTFGREPSTDWRGWAADVVKKSGHSKKALANRVDDIVRQANGLL